MNVIYLAPVMPASNNATANMTIAPLVFSKYCFPMTVFGSSDSPVAWVVVLAHNIFGIEPHYLASICPSSVDLVLANDAAHAIEALSSGSRSALALR